MEPARKAHWGPRAQYTHSCKLHGGSRWQVDEASFRRCTLLKQCWYSEALAATGGPALIFWEDDNGMAYNTNDMILVGVSFRPVASDTRNDAKRNEVRIKWKNDHSPAVHARA